MVQLSNLKAYKNQAAFIILSVVIVIIVVVAALSLLSYIDEKLRDGAEQQVKTFTEQAAANVSDRIANCESAIGAFVIESTDLARVRPALAALKERFSFSSVSFARNDGVGCEDGGSDFSVADLPVSETALSDGDASYSVTYEAADGQKVRLFQTPLSIDGERIGALYVEIPVSMFSMERGLDMFDGRGYFILFDAKTEEIIVPPTDPTDTPIGKDTTVYDFLFESQRAGGEESMFFRDEQFVREKSSIDQIRRAVADGGSDMFTGSIDGQESYVCVAPVNTGFWYVCNVIPVENVRAERSAVLAAFQLVFALVITCVVGALILSYLFYRKRMLEKGIEMKTRLYGALSDSLDMAVNMYSPEDAIVTPIVAKAIDILGYSMHDLISKKSVADEIGLSDEGLCMLHRVRGDKIESLEQGEFHFEDRWGHGVSWVFYSIVPFEYEGKRQLLIVFRDVTDEKVLELSMKDAMVAAETANKAKSDFLSNMSHEIRTPMNAIIGMTQIARKNLGNDVRVRENLDKIDVASEHLLNIINDVLDISKIESGKMILANEVFSLSDVIDRVVNGMQSLGESRHQTLTVTRRGIDADAFVGDQVRIRQIIINLLTNAMKYTPEGGAIRFDIVEQQSKVKKYVHVTLTIADNGIGMAEEYLEHLFDPFDMEGRSSTQGTGLGMAIVKNIVTMLNGDIHVESAIDSGTTFTVSLDLLRASKDEKQLLITDAPASKVPAIPGGDGDRTGAGLAGSRILLAEDNDLNAEIARELLADAGLLVEWAQNGEHACRMFEGSEPGYYDAILMDIQMPIMNGYEAARSIRSSDHPDAEAVTIVAMSANAFMEDVEMSLRCGMDAHLSKPIDMMQVLSTIEERIINRKRR